jgi:hypothetical protein
MKAAMLGTVAPETAPRASSLPLSVPRLPVVRLKEGCGECA